jgi:hypothetical protein
MLIGISRVGAIEVGGLITPASTPVVPVTPAYVQAIGRRVIEYQVDRRIIARKKMDTEPAVKKLQKRASDVLDYDFDYTEFLAKNTDSISSSTVASSPPGGINLTSKSNYSTIVKQWISGGTVGATYSVVCTMTSALGRIRSLELQLTILPG